LVRDLGRFDVAVLGAGAAGLLAAIRASERGRSTVLLEKNRRPGVKILISGGTRCNLTNARGLRDLSVVSGPIDPAYDASQGRGARAIQDAFGPAGRFLGPALRALSVDRTIGLFEAEGVATKVEANGKIFPVSDRATEVLDGLLGRLRRAGATLRTSCPALSIEPREDGFEVNAPEGSIRAARVIIAVGGQSYPGAGTSGDGYLFGRRFGHTIVEPRPALVPLRVQVDWVASLKGITIPDVVVKVLEPGVSTPLLRRRESLLFAHFGLSGPAILDVSRAVARHGLQDRLALALDLVPVKTAQALNGWLQASCRAGRVSVAGLVAQLIPRRVADAVLAEAQIPLDRVGPELTRDERRSLVINLKDLRLPVVGTLGFAKAEVTSGGIALDEVNSENMESRRQPGLFLIGEVLDLDGLIGGYNFQAAWSTGWLAGESV
jgi:predicted Rossmann fold flavoprotein